MGARLRSWRQQIKQRWVAVGIIIGCVVLVGLIVAFVGGYIFNWSWTGLGPYVPPTKDSGFQREKTLWDWLQLLIVPVILAIGISWLNQIQKSREESTTRQQADLERAIAADNQQEAALQAYIDKISELLLHEKLRKSERDDEVRNIARVRTLTVLSRLDKGRKRSVLQFLYESSLIQKDEPIVDLVEADLSNADLGWAYLRNANLSGAHLRGADMGLANLREANLSDAVLNKANLMGADLHNAILSRTNLGNAVLRKADLSGVDLSETNLYGANLSDADLRGADLSGDDSGEVSLIATTLFGVDLSGANLSGARVTQEQLDQVKSLKGATMPNGSKHL